VLGAAGAAARTSCSDFVLGAALLGLRALSSEPRASSRSASDAEPERSDAEPRARTGSLMIGRPALPVSSELRWEFGPGPPRGGGCCSGGAVLFTSITVFLRRLRIIEPSRRLLGYAADRRRGAAPAAPDEAGRTRRRRREKATMEQHHTLRDGRTIRRGLIGVGVLALLLLAARGGQRGTGTGVRGGMQTAEAAPAPAAAPWTAVASSGAIDESSASIYAFTDASLGYRPGLSVAAITARYSVVDTFHGGPNPRRPPWTTLELSSTAPGNSRVRATLIRVKPCTGVQERICVTENVGGIDQCTYCNPITGGPIDFVSYLYYVLVEIQRSNPNQLPKAYGLRIY
jgi:hypothetical protein